MSYETNKWDADQQVLLKDIENQKDILYTSLSIKTTSQVINLYGDVQTNEIFFSIVNEHRHEIYDIKSCVEYKNGQLYQKENTSEHPYGYFKGSATSKYFALERINGNAVNKPSEFLGILDNDSIIKLYNLAGSKGVKFWQGEGGVTFSVGDGPNGTSLSLPVLNISFC